jgi:SOS-response transcriptional repressor LexA
MDVTWFKQQQRRAGVTSFDLGEAIGRDRSVISRIINGQQRMTLDQARAIAEKLDVPLAEMIERAGLGDKQTGVQLSPGFAESDAAAWVPGFGEVNTVKPIAVALGERPGVDIWRIKTRAMALAGLLEGDFMLVDTHQAERAKAGDVVVAQVYNRSGATTVLRRFEPPVLVAASADPADGRVYVVDGQNVVIMGKIVASWRT